MKQLSDYLYHETERGVLYCGDCLEIIKQLPDESIDCCITSPPYWGLRDYGTAEWIGGSADCAHRIDRFGNRKVTDNTIIDQSKQTSLAGEFVAVNETCPKCGAVRKDSQLGLEKTPEQYVANMVTLFREVRRVLKKDGVLWLNLGDSYAATRWSNTPGTGFQGEGSASNVRIEKETNLKPKDLVGIPWRVAFALQAGFCTCSECGLEMRTDLWATRNGHKVCIECLYNGKKDSKVIHSETGWYLRQDIIWHKPNPMPESVTDRCTKAHEYIFLMSKSAKYYYDNEAIREDIKITSQKQLGGVGNYADGIRNNNNYKLYDEIKGANKRSVWTVTTKPFKEAHFATFPPDLILPCVLTSRKDAVILDPFFGSGTTGMVAVQNGRNYVGIDLNEKYCEIAKRRIETALDQTEIDL